MNISNFFIERPIFAGVISAFITIAGLIALFKLPISEYREVVPPSVVVHASYPGANPKVIADTVAAPLEQAIVGVEDMLYMSSTSTMDGALTLTVTFRIGADIDRAQVQVQNRVAQALPRLPEEVRSLGVNTVKASSNLTLVGNLTSPSGRYDSLYLRNYPVLNIKDLLPRLPGMGDVQVFGGGDYLLRYGSSPPGRMLWSSPPACARPWRSSRGIFRRAWTTAFSTTPRSSCASRSMRSCTHCWKPYCWSCWW